jgi:ParB family chromosome partitioning protein
VTRRLGKGLGSLLGEPSESTGPSAELDVSQIRANPFQPRSVFDSTALEELRDSIQRHGILQPIVVRRVQGGYELISGERRWRASKQAGLNRIPAIVRDEVSDAEMLELALVENVQRKDLDPIERARGFKALMEKLSLTQQGIADRVGLKRTTVANHLRLLELPTKVQEAVGSGLLSMGHARALLGLPTASAMVAAVGQIVRKDLSVREVERMVRDRASRGGQPGAGSAEGEDRPEPWVGEMQRRMQEYLGTKVSLLDREGKRGRIVIEYYTRADLDRLCELLAPRETL